ncbi:MAG TPA: MopE-related protein, partial [Polyangiaceae bacterium]|nr:MopE-related protein [Polyangiaceae bacterium]
MRRLALLALFFVGCGRGTAADPFVVGASAGAGGEGAAAEGGAGGQPGVAAECSTDEQCDDGFACTTDACDLARNTCVHAPDDSVCDDGIYCNGAETCEPALGCQPGPVVGCSDNSGCTIDTCVEATQSCKHEPRDADGDGDPPIACEGGDCDDFDPLVSSQAHERCDNGKDDDCDGDIDESDCVRPLYDRCGDALDVKEAGAYAFTTVGTSGDYPISCEKPADGRAFRDIVVAIVVPDGGPRDVDLAAVMAKQSPHFEAGELVIAATDQCGKAAGETACEASVVTPEGDSIARVVLRGLSPGAHAVYLAADREADLELHVAFRDPAPAPANETCGTAQKLEPNTPVRAILAGVHTDLDTACTHATGDLVYRFELGARSDVTLQAAALDDYGDPVLSLRDADCTELASELTCRAASPVTLFARGLPEGSYRVALSGTGPTEAEVVLGVAKATDPPATQGCSDPPALKAGVTKSVSLDLATDAVRIGCLVGAADATYALALDEASDVMVVQTGSDGDTGSALIASPPCELPADRVSCTSSDQWPVRAVAHGVGPGSVRAVVETAQGKPTSITAFTRPATNSVFVQAADECSDAFTIPEDGGRFEGSTANQYAQYDVSCDYGGQLPGGAPEQMLELVLHERRRVVIDASGSSYQTAVVVRNADGCP